MTSVWRSLRNAAALFTLAVGLVMVFDYVSARSEDPLNSPQLQALKDDLRATPESDDLKAKIRELDLDLRQRYFRYIARMNSGVWLLIIGATAALVAAARARFPHAYESISENGRVSLAPQSETRGAPTQRAYNYLRTRATPDAPASSKNKAFSAVAATGLATLLFLGWLAVTSAPSALPSRMARAETPSGPATEDGPDCASPAELNRNWSRFRGPGGNGVALAGKAPISWNAETASGIAWKVPSPVPGFNSPIVFDSRIFIAGGDASKLEIVALNLNDGQVVWRQPIQAPSGAQTAEVPESTGYAPSTMATDGRRVYAIFANGLLGAINVDGRPAWTKSFGALSNPYGHAISLVTWQDRVIVQLDQGESGEGKSVLYMLDGRTGRPVWQKPRTLGASWASPIVFEAAGHHQILTLSIPFAIAYSAASGEELWRADCLNGEVTPSPIFAGNRLIVASPSDRIMSIRPDGRGDVTKTHVEWSFDEDIPDVTSPVGNGELIFFVSTHGGLTCIDAKDGSKVWTQDLEFECHASPAIAGGHLYLFGQEGSVVIAEVARQYKEVFRTKMPDSFHASPAFVQDSIVVRGMSSMWRLGSVTTPEAGGGPKP